MVIPDKTLVLADFGLATIIPPGEMVVSGLPCGTKVCGGIVISIPPVPLGRFSIAMAGLTPSSRMQPPPICVLVRDQNEDGVAVTFATRNTGRRVSIHQCLEVTVVLTKISSPLPPSYAIHLFLVCCAFETVGHLLHRLRIWKAALKKLGGRHAQTLMLNQAPAMPKWISVFSGAH